MGASRWSVELAGLTPLHLHLYSVDLNHTIERLSEIILLVCVLWKGGEEGEKGRGGMGGWGRAQETGQYP